MPAQQGSDITNARLPKQRRRMRGAFVKSAELDQEHFGVTGVGS